MTMLYPSGLFRKLSSDLITKNAIICFAQQNIHQYKSCLKCSFIESHARKYTIDKSKIVSVPSNIKLNLLTRVTYSTEQELSTAQYEKISDETLESLTEYFEEVIEDAAHLTEADVSYGDGVLTVKFGGQYGTYVINRQTPNKQIWLSSPKSGPKRYDFIDSRWIYKHDGKSLHELLDNEIPDIVKTSTYFDKCSFSGVDQHASLNNL